MLTATFCCFQGVSRAAEQRLWELNCLSWNEALITCNGTAFDLPRIRRELGIDLQIPHLDLLPCLNALGYRGGLKRCEQLIGLRRSIDTAGCGKDAVALWHQYEASGDETALLRLVRYNLQDAVSLKSLAVAVYNRVMAGFPLRLQLPRPEQPDISAYELDVALWQFQRTPYIVVAGQLRYTMLVCSPHPWGWSVSCFHAERPC